MSCSPLEREKQERIAQRAGININRDSVARSTASRE